MINAIRVFLELLAYREKPEMVVTTHDSGRVRGSQESHKNRAIVNVLNGLGFEQ